MLEVSVVIPTWNRSELLERAVRSALAQTIPSLEVLVCDDGSTDLSEQVIRSLGDSRVRWISGERGGRPAIPRNRGISTSRGEWIAFLDNDDEWLPDKLEKQLSAATNLNCLASCGNALRFIPGQGALGNYLSWKQERVTFDDLLKVNQVICSSAVVHHSLFSQIKCFPEEEELKALEDYALWFRVGTFTDFAYLDEPLLSYRDESSSSVRSNGVEVYEQRRRVFKDFLSWGKRCGIPPACLWKVRRRLLRDFVERVSSRLLKPAKMVAKAVRP